MANAVIVCVICVNEGFSYWELELDIEINII